ncbi:MAG: hypothetical protein ACT452_06710 [Microthrixaceae bacterium]
MRSPRATLLGAALVAGYVGLMGWTSWESLHAADRDRGAPGVAVPAEETFAAAWERSRTETYLATGVYERRSEVTGATVSSEDVVAQRPPRRLHRQLAGVAGRDDDRLVVCPAPPLGDEARAAPCQLGPPGGETYAQSVEREVEGVRMLTSGPRPLYRVVVRRPGCFHLTRERVDPRAPFGQRATFCFDDATGAVVSSTVHHEGGVVEVLSVSTVRRRVSDADLEP